MADIDFNMVLRILQVVIFPVVAWFWSRIQELKKEMQEQKEDNSDLRDRLSRCEAQVENTPSKESVHELMLQLSHMGGGLKAMEVRLEAFDGSVRRSERVMERVEKYLLENAR